MSNISLSRYALGAAAAGGAVILAIRLMNRGKKPRHQDTNKKQRPGAVLDPVGKYCQDHSTSITSAQKRLIQRTMELPPDVSVMLSSTDEFQFLQIMVQSIGATKTLDIGTFTGYSALSIALALPDDGRVISMDVSDQFSELAMNAFKEAGVEKKVKLRVGPAVETLDALIEDGESGTFDFAFIDADKVNYRKYYEKGLQLLRRGGILAVDNTLWETRVLDPTITDSKTVSIRELNSAIVRDVRVHAVLLNIADGVTIVYKL